MCSVFIRAATESPQVGISAAVKTYCAIHGFSFVLMGLEQEKKKFFTLASHEYNLNQSNHKVFYLFIIIQL